MKLLLDTPVLLGWLNDDDKLSEYARQLISPRKIAFTISQVSLWEIQIKAMTGKLNANVASIIQQLPENNFEQLMLHSSHILALGTLPQHL